MKVKVKAVIDDDKSVNFDIAVGRGDKTFKWLGSVVTHRFSITSNPNGSLRRREDYRGATENTNYYIAEITLPNGEVPHPSSMLYDFLMNNDEVIIYLATTQKLNHTRSPNHSQWTTVAYTTGDDSKENEEEEDEEEEEDDNVEVRNGMRKENVVQSNSSFMKIIFKSQMINHDEIINFVNTLWNSRIQKLMPKLTEENNSNFKAIFIEHYNYYSELYYYYTSNSNNMTHSQYMQVMNDLGLFDSATCDKYASRIFNRIHKVSPDEFDLSAMMVSIIVAAQIKNNDTFDNINTISYTNTMKALDSIKDVLENNVYNLAEKLELPSILKGIFSSPVNLNYIHRYHESHLVPVYNKYAVIGKEMPSSLSMTNMAQCLFESGLQAAEDVEGAKVLFNLVRRGHIYGRSIPSDERLIIPTDEFNYAEFVEAVCYAGFLKFKSTILSTKNLAGTDSSLTIEKSYQKGIDGAMKSLTYVEEVVVTKNSRRTIIS